MPLLPWLIATTSSSFAAKDDGPLCSDALDNVVASTIPKRRSIDVIVELKFVMARVLFAGDGNMAVNRAGASVAATTDPLPDCTVSLTGTVAGIAMTSNRTVPCVVPLKAADFIHTHGATQQVTSGNGKSAVVSAKGRSSLVSF